MRFTYAKFKGKDQARSVHTIGPVVISENGIVSADVAKGFDIKKAAFLATLHIDRAELYPDYNELLVTKYGSIGTIVSSPSLALEHRIEQVRVLCSRYSCLMLVGYDLINKKYEWSVNNGPIDLSTLNARYRWEVNYETTIITDGDGWLPIMPVSDVPILSELVDFPCVFGTIVNDYTHEPYSITQQAALLYAHRTEQINNNGLLKHVGGRYQVIPSVRRFYTLGKQNKRMIRESIRRYFSGNKELVKR